MRGIHVIQNVARMPEAFNANRMQRAAVCVCRNGSLERSRETRYALDVNALRYDKKATSPLRNSPNHGQPWNTEQEQESYSFAIYASNDRSYIQAYRCSLTVLQRIK